MLLQSSRLNQQMIQMITDCWCRQSVQSQQNRSICCRNDPQWLPCAAIMQADLSKRYGCLANGVDDIKNHPWFKGTDWAAADNLVHEPPIQ